MIIKKFLALTETEAIEMAKEELGSDAVVMNIKKIQPRGLAKLFVRAKVEVTAAVDEESSKTGSAGSGSRADASGAGASNDGLSQTAVKWVGVTNASDDNRSRNSAPPVPPMPKKQPDEQSIEEKLKRLEALLEQQMKGQPLTAGENGEPAGGNDRSGRINGNDRNSRSNRNNRNDRGSRNDREDWAPDTGAGTRNGSNVISPAGMGPDGMDSNGMDPVMKGSVMKGSAANAEDQEDDKTVAYKELIRKQLIQNEVQEDIADSIMEEVDRSLPRNAPIDQILASVYQKLILMMGRPYLIDERGESDKTKFVFFLGSTGVGKTTTIAKIASKLKLQDKAKLVLVTADTYRIAAVEQLKTYANILGVPLKVIYSPDELGASLDELREYEYCLVDTSGRSHKNEEQIEDIRKLIEQVPIAERQVYLVLNASMKYTDLQEVAKVYAELTDFSIIFTKLDETFSAGAMLNIHVMTKCPLSYVTTGQNVPDDISEIDAQKMVKELLGGNAVNG